MHLIQLVLDAKDELGEGPSWDSRRKVLYWVDSSRQKLHLYSLAKKEHTIAVLRYPGWPYTQVSRI